MRFLFLILAFVCTTAHAQDTSDGGNTLRVGLVERPPFAMLDEDVGWSGLAVDLMRQVAEQEGLSYRIVPLDGDPSDAVGSGRVDIALPADAAPRGDGVVYTQPFYTSTLGLAGSRGVDLLGVAGNVISWQFLRVVLFLAAMLLVVGTIVWLIERRRNDMFPEGTAHGIGAGFWWAGVTMTTIGYGDKAPVTPGGRAVALVWMLVAMIVTAALTATLISAVGLGGGGGLPDEIEGRVGAVEGSTAERYLKARGLTPVIVQDAEEGLDAVGGDLDSFLGDEPLVRHLVSGRSSLDLSVKGSTIDPHYVSFAVGSNVRLNGEPLVERLNRAILKRLPTPAWWELTRRYVPGDD